MASNPSGISNVINTYKAIAGNVAASVGITNAWSSQITATTSNKTINKALEVVANNPFTTAAVVAGGITAARNAPAIASAIKTSFSTGSTTVATQTATKAAASSMPSWIVPAALGVGAASLFNGKNAPQDTAQTSAPSVITNSTQNTFTDARQWNNQINNSKSLQRTTNTIQGSPYASLGGSPRQDYAFEPSQTPTQSVSAMPNQTTPIDQYAGQTASQAQNAGMNWTMLALIGLGAYVLGSRK